MDQLRVLQVGLGGWGRDWARQVIPEIPEVDLVGYVDPDPSALAQLRDAVPLAPELCFLTLEQAIEATQPEAVLITTTIPGHAPVTRAALGAGLHVLVEKPFAESLEVGRQLVELAATRRKVLMVSQNYRFFPAVQVACEVVRSGELGPVDCVYVDFRFYDHSLPRGERLHYLVPQPMLVHALDPSPHAAYKLEPHRRIVAAVQTMLASATPLRS